MQQSYASHDCGNKTLATHIPAAAKSFKLCQPKPKLAPMLLSPGSRGTGCDATISFLNLPERRIEVRPLHAEEGPEQMIIHLSES